MKICITTKYLTFPVNVQTASKKVSLYEDGEWLFDFDCKLDMRNPNFTAYVDVSRFMGKTVELAVFPEMTVDVGMADEMALENYGHEDLRPKIHFTVPNGWNNDPNGLIRYRDKYHMFYQYNPCSTEWGNMHWGHAVSEDLLHWEHLDIAMFPDETGVMYSGCTIEDVKNVSPISKIVDRPMLVYYTAAGGKTIPSKGKFYDQRLAYSVDNGKTLIKYDGEPMLPTIEKGNRDPKVVWVEEMNRYVMVLYMIGHKYSLFSSEDLMTWTHFQDLEIADDAECPDIYPMVCDGEKLWVISGASDIYLVGQFTENGFVKLQSERRLTHSRVNYAAQSFSGMDDGRVVRIAWQRVQIPSCGFSQQMSIPMEMNLEKRGEEYFLTANPIREIASLYDQSMSFEGSVSETPVRFELGENPADIKIQIQHEKNTSYRILLFGVPLMINFKDGIIQYKGIKMPFDHSLETLDLRVIVDRCTIEVFANSGRYCFSEMNLCDFNLPYVEFSANEHLKNLKVEGHMLKSIFPR